MATHNTTHDIIVNNNIRHAKARKDGNMKLLFHLQDRKQNIIKKSRKDKVRILHRNDNERN